MNDVDLVERVGTHVVAKIKGDLQETFDRLDEDGDGQISASELAALLADVNQGQAVDEESVQRVMSEVAKRRDAEGNGIILFDDFRKWYGTRLGHSSGRRTAPASSSSSSPRSSRHTLSRYMQSEQRMRADLDEMWCKIVGAIHLDADMETATRLVATLLGLNILSIEKEKVEEHLKDMDADKDGKVRDESVPSLLTSTTSSTSTSPSPPIHSATPR